MDRPLVSIIMPAYNVEDYIHESIASVLHQTYNNWELLIIDDASTDNTLSIINTFKDVRIIIYSLNKNKGVANARNYGIDKCKGRFIAFLDADDLWTNDKLQLQTEFMLQNNFYFTFTWYHSFKDAQNTKHKKLITAPASVSFHQLLKNNIIGCLTAMYDSSYLGKKYFPELKMRQDYALWLSILKNGVYAHCLPESLALYRIRKTSLTAKKLSVLKYNWKLLRQHQNLSLLQSIYYFSCFGINKIKKQFW